ncbi:unnamed protein product [Effrenium voratum]|nr:unnamed protein product [Effrenium voratum]
MQDSLHSALKEASIGPYDFAWLLERVADFGQEPATFNGTSDWKPEAPPKPVQLLVPEMILFNEGTLQAFFFTDCAGFLRGSRRALKQPYVVYHCMEQIMKQRKLDIDLPLLLRDTDLERTFTPGESRRCSRSSRESESRRKPRSTVFAKAQVRRWTLWVGSAKQRVPETEVAERLAGIRNVPWPSGTRLLQASFWSSEKFIVYDYDALRSDVKGAIHGRLDDIINNHFERFTFLDSVRDRNKISAVPNLLAQHLGYHCNLELVSGKFTFYKDSKAQLWLCDASHLFLAPSVSRGKSNAFEALPQKIFRYLSEEALQNLPVEDSEGLKQQRMFELMISDYEAMKVQFGMDRMLRKVQQELDTNIPVLEGTDVEALSRTFDLNCGPRKQTAATRRFEVQAPPRQPIGRCRWFPAQEPKEVRQNPRAKILARGRQMQAAARASDLSQSEDSKSCKNRLSKTRTLERPKGIKIEIVSTAVAVDLLEGAGTGACPEGPTIDTVRPRLCPPGQGLQMTRKAQVPRARAVVVPPGAASQAMGRLKASMQAEEEKAYKDMQEQQEREELSRRRVGWEQSENVTRDCTKVSVTEAFGRSPQDRVDDTYLRLDHQFNLAECSKGACWKVAMAAL